MLFLFFNFKFKRCFLKQDIEATIFWKNVVFPMHMHVVMIHPLQMIYIRYVMPIHAVPYLQALPTRMLHSLVVGACKSDSHDTVVLV